LLGHFLTQELCAYWKSGQKDAVYFQKRLQTISKNFVLQKLGHSLANENVERAILRKTALYQLAL
jgi:hypothetical protein